MLPSQPIRLVAIDLDDTLLNKQKQISARNRDALRRAKEQGVVVTLVTGRMYASALPYARSLQLDLPIVTYQGGLIRKSISQETLFESVLDPGLTWEICRTLEQFPGDLSLTIDDEFYADSENETARRYRELHHVKVHIIGCLSEWLQSQTAAKIYKIIYTDAPERILQAMEALLPFANRANLTRSYPVFLEIGPRGIHKGFAIHWLAQYFNIPEAAILVIGDGGNDIDMFAAAGFSVCMGDGQPEARAAASYVGKSCEEDGVADALERFVLREE
ncbi:MAG: Cof-type HAD-IIB family hydrolase [Negativicutes bacterium]|nr:Cof-type HAD-IIB family hydrolase [Negativicutes bacterium]